MTPVNKLTCSECLSDIVDSKKIIKHNNWIYCDAECLNERINLDLSYEWVVFKNSIDIMNNEIVLGSLTLQS